MDLVVNTTLSMEFWRQRYPLDRSPLLSCAVPSASSSLPSEVAYSLRDVNALTPDWITNAMLDKYDGSMQVLAFDSRHRRASANHAVRIWTSENPPGSFYRLSGTLLIASPGFIFLVAASSLDKHALIAFGNELCGLYSFDENALRGFRTRRFPLTTPEHLGSYLQNAVHCRGYNQAMAALKHIIPNAASPMEPFCAMKLYLPPRLGGYTFSKPIMNHEVPLSRRARIIARQSKCYADICYPGHRLALEYLGEYDHADPAKMSQDRARECPQRDGLRGNRAYVSAGM